MKTLSPRPPHKGAMYAILASAVSLTIAHKAAAEEWTPVGDATFTDGWVSPHHTGKTATWTVAAEISADGSLIRIAEPYASDSFTGIAGTEAEATGHHLIFDITDPMWVTIASAQAIVMPAGTVSTSAQPLWLTSRGIYMHQRGYSREAITEAGLNSTWRNQTITIPQCMVAHSDDPDALTYSFAETPLTSVIDLSALNLAGLPVATQTPVGTPVYFNISGTPVTAPVEAGIYIRVTPSGASKILIH